jgi:hypothetical protein
MARDGYVMLCEHLLPEEAGMAQGLLESAGIGALVEDVHLSSVDPLVRLAISGAKLLVPVSDVGRAREVLAEAGVAVPGRAGRTEVPEIPEEEWSRPTPEAAPSPQAPARTWSRATVILAVAAFVLALLLRRACP